MNAPPDGGRQDDLDELIGRVAREMTEREPPRDLAGRVRDRIEGGRASRPRIWQAGAVAAVILLAAVIGTVLRTPGGTPPDRAVTTLPPPPDAPPALPPPAPPVTAGSEVRTRQAPRAARTEDAVGVLRPADRRDGAGRDSRRAARIDPPPQVELAPLPGPEPLRVSVAVPAELTPPEDLVLSDIAVRDLTIPPLDPWKESR
jgi:hypothetical protein